MLIDFDRAPSIEKNKYKLNETRMKINTSKCLGPLQFYHHRMNTMGTYSTFIVGAQLSVSVETHFQKIREELANLVHYRSFLRVDVVEIDGKLYPCEIMDIDVDSQIERVDKPYSTKLLAELHAITIEPGQGNPLWKVILTNDDWIIFLVEHTCLDGNSGAFILEELGALLNGQVIPEESDRYAEFSNLVKPDITVILRALWEIIVPNDIKSLFNYFKKGDDAKYSHFGETWVPVKAAPVKNPTFKTFHYEVNIPKQKMAILKQLLKENGVKFTSYLTYAAVRSVSQFTDQYVSGHTSINLRQLLDIPPASYGLFMTLMVQTYKTSKAEDIDWDQVRYIQSRLAPDNLFRSAKLIGLLGLVDIDIVLRTLLTLQRNSFFAVSNLGVRIDYKNQEYQWKDFVFAQPASLVSPFITHDVIGCSENTKIIIGGVPEVEEYFEKYCIEFGKMFCF